MIRKSDFSIETDLGWVVGNDCIDMSCLNASSSQNNNKVNSQRVGKEHEIFRTQLQTSGGQK